MQVHLTSLSQTNQVLVIFGLIQQMIYYMFTTTSSWTNVAESSKIMFPQLVIIQLQVQTLGIAGPELELFRDNQTCKCRLLGTNKVSVIVQMVQLKIMQKLQVRF